MFSSSLIFLKKDHKTVIYDKRSTKESEVHNALHIRHPLKLGIPTSQILSTGTETQILPVPHTHATTGHLHFS